MEDDEIAPPIDVPHAREDSAATSRYWEDAGHIPAKPAHGKEPEAGE